MNKVYRIFNKDYNKWCNDVIVLPDGALAKLERRLFNRYKMRVLWDETPYVVHNETGVDDKHGYRIFEGDICATPKVKDGIVAFSTEVGSYCIFDYNDSVYYVLYDEAGKDVEVIGNVFDGIVVDITQDDERDGKDA